MDYLLISTRISCFRLFGFLNGVILVVSKPFWEVLIRHKLRHFRIPGMSGRGIPRVFLVEMSQ